MSTHGIKIPLEAPFMVNGVQIGIVEGYAIADDRTGELAGVAIWQKPCLPDLEIVHPDVNRACFDPFKYVVAKCLWDEANKPGNLATLMEEWEHENRNRRAYAAADHYRDQMKAAGNIIAEGPSGQCR